MWSLGGSGCESLVGVRCTGFVDGDCLWDLSLGQHTGDGKFDGKSFWVGCGWFFSWGGRGRGRGTPGQVLLRCFHRTTRVPKSTFYVIYYILISGGFTVAWLQTIVKVPPDPRGPGQTRVMFKFRQPDDFFHTLKTVKGLPHLVPSRTPRIRVSLEHYTPNIYRCILT